MENKNDALMTGAPIVRASWVAGNELGPFGRQLSLADIWFSLWKRRVAIFLCTIGVFSFFALYVIVKRPIYESIAQIRVDSSQQGGLGLEDLVSQHFSDSDSEG